MEKEFINKNNLTYLNNNLTQRLDLQSKSESEKKKCLQVLLNNMKSVYSKLDKSKITQNNINKVMKSFYKYSVDLSVKELELSSKMQPVNRNITNFNRDKEINGNRNVSYMDRQGFNDFNNNTYSNFDLSKRNDDYTQSINRNASFNPSDDMRSGINARQVNDGEPPEKSYEKLLQSRNIDVPSRNERPPTPDFSLDGSGSKEKKNNLDNIENFQNMTISDNTQLTDSFLSRTEESIDVSKNRMEGDTYHLVGSNLETSFGNVNFGNNELSQNIPDDIDESINVSDRLKQLQSERSSFDSYISKDEAQQRPQTDEISNNNNSYMNERNMQTNPDYQNQQMQMQIEQQKQMQQEKLQRERLQMQQAQMQQAQMQQAQMQQKETFNNNINESSVYNIPNQQLYDMINNVYQNIPKNENVNVKDNKINSMKKGNNVSSMRREDESNLLNDQNNELNNYLNELNKTQLNQLKQIQELQNQMQRQLQNQNFSSNNNESYQEDDKVKNELISKMKIVTGELEQYKRTNSELKKKLDEEIRNKETENDKKINIIDRKKEEIKLEVMKLGTKHRDIDESYKKLVNYEKSIKDLIKKNSDILSLEKKSYLLNSKLYNNLSRYTYNFDNEIENIKRIELMSYDFPLISNNINDLNNKVNLRLESTKSIETNNESDSETRGSEEEEDTTEIIIPNGNYDISSLIKKMNKLCKSYQVTFTYNKNTSKVTVKLDNEDNNFTIINSNNSILKNLGFTNDIYENENVYISENSYDLRKNKYVKIKLCNLDDPEFAEVSISSEKNNVYYKNYDPPICSLDHLDIEIQDDNGKPIDFCNLPHKIEFCIIKNQSQTIDLSYFQKNSNLIDEQKNEDKISINSEDIIDNEQILIDANNADTSEQDPQVLINALKGRLNELGA